MRPEPKSSPISVMAAVRPFSVISLPVLPSCKAWTTRPTMMSFSPSMTACLMASRIGRSVVFMTAAFFGTARFDSSWLKARPQGSSPRSAALALRAFCIDSSYGFMIGASRPAARHMVKKVLLISGRFGRPNEMFERPIVEG